MNPLTTLEQAGLSRRGFLTRAGGGLAALSVVAAGCDSDDPDPMPGAVTLDFSNDFGVLNYAYALEQLEAAFYAAVVGAAGFATAFPSADERAGLTAIAKHEAIHAAFLKAALGSNAIGNLTPDFSSVNFSSRASVLGTSLVFEDLGVAAYNGAGKFISDPGYLTLAGKIVSVEARHASYIAGLITPNTIAGSGVIN
ncbi:MAG TPA: ferritin-like domain-containing protein, partial [Rhodothermales bacterium]|nr:ferritin-like domain-containing protein [Rhodothermales bacterium]